MPHPKRARSSEDLIDANLKQIFQEAVEEELPERFRLLIDRLRSGEPDGQGCSKDASSGVRK